MKYKIQESEYPIQKLEGYDIGVYKERGIWISVVTCDNGTLGGFTGETKDEAIQKAKDFLSKNLEIRYIEGDALAFKAFIDKHYADHTVELRNVDGKNRWVVTENGEEYIVRPESVIFESTLISKDSQGNKKIVHTSFTGAKNRKGLIEKVGESMAKKILHDFKYLENHEQ